MKSIKNISKASLPILSLGILIAALALSLGSFVTADDLNKSNPFAKTVAQVEVSDKVEGEAIASAQQLSVAFRSAAGRVLPSVVAIETHVLGQSNPFSRQSGEKHGIGSGVIVDSSGIILTNNHVVMGGDGQVTVRLSDGREYDAHSIATDPKTDIAVVKIQGATNLKPAKMGNSEKTEIGDWVLALGQPFGLESSVTAGIISAKNRGIGITDRENFLQTDAAINPGNSGGPLVNLKGEIIGINTAISSSSGGNNGVGFAVPINLARWIGDQLLTHGKVKRAYLGVGIQALDHQLAKKLNAPQTRGVVVTHIQPGTPAAQAGLSTGDIIASINGKQIGSPSQLQLAIERVLPGEKQQLLVVRDGQERRIDFAATKLPSEKTVTRRVTMPKSKTYSNELGLQIAPVNGDLARRFQIPQSENGVVIAVVKQGGLADRAGLKPGMLITNVERRPVTRPEDAVSAFDDASIDDGILVLVKTPVGSRFVVIKST